jgi:hypothetical protein
MHRRIGVDPAKRIPQCIDEFIRQRIEWILRCEPQQHDIRMRFDK